MHDKGAHSGRRLSDWLMRRSDPASRGRFSRSPSEDRRRRRPRWDGGDDGRYGGRGDGSPEYSRRRRSRHGSPRRSSDRGAVTGRATARRREERWSPSRSRERGEGTGRSRRGRSRGSSSGRGRDRSSRSPRSARRPREKSAEKPRKKKSKWDMPAITGGADNPLRLLGEAGYAAPATPVEDRRGRRLYVGNLPSGATESSIVQFFNGALLAAAGVDYAIAAAAGQFPVLKAEVGPRKLDAAGDHRYCFLEFRTIADGNVCLRLDGINFNGNMLKIGRPNDYAVFPTPTERSTGEALAEALERTRLREMVGLRETKVYVQDAPQTLSDEALHAMAVQFGPVLSAALVKDVRSGTSLGYGIIEFEREEDAKRAVAALDKVPMGQYIPRFTSKPVVKPVVATPPADAAAAGPAAAAGAAGSSGTCSSTVAASSHVTELAGSMTFHVLADAVIGAQVKAARAEGEKPSRVVQLLNAVYSEDLINDDEYNALKTEIEGEAAEYGQLEACVIPRPPPGLREHLPGVGKVFLHFSDITAARKAQWEFNGRLFDRRRVVCAAFYNEEAFKKGQYVLMQN